MSLPYVSCFNHLYEFVFTYDLYAEFFGLLQLRRSHVLAREDKRGLVADAPHVLTAVLFDDGLVLVAAVVGEDTADDDALSLKFS